MTKFIITGIITILIIVGAIFLFGGEKSEFATNEDYFIAIVETALIEKYGDTLSGYEPGMIINTFKNAVNEDFEGVETGFGAYEVINGGIVFRPIEGESFSESKAFISKEGMTTLLNNLSTRLEIEIIGQSSVEDIIQAIR